MISGEAASQRWLNGTTSGTARSKYVEGVNSVTESPMAKAATPEAMELYARRVQESVNSGKRAQKLLATPISRWKENAAKKGADRLASGAQAAVDKVRAHFQKWGPVYQQVSDAVAQMPKGSVQAAKDRANRAIEMLMAAAGRS